MMSRHLVRDIDKERRWIMYSRDQYPGTTTSSLDGLYCKRENGRRSEQGRSVGEATVHRKEKKRKEKDAIATSATRTGQDRKKPETMRAGDNDRSVAMRAMLVVNHTIHVARVWSGTKDAQRATAAAETGTTAQPADAWPENEHERIITAECPRRPPPPLPRS